MKKKILALLLVVVCMVSFVFTGCKNDKEGKVKSNIKVSAPNEFPIVEEPVELTVFVPKSEWIADLETNEFTKKYEELTNVKIKWEVASGDATQAVNIKLASGEYPDIFYGFTFTKEQQNIYAEQGIFQDISGYIDEYGYYAKKFLEDYPAVKDDISINGGIYGLPNFVESPFAVYYQSMWVYKPWLDKLGLDLPTTTDEFYEMLVAFRDKDPNGNGKKDEIPLAARGVAKDFGIESYLMSAFIPLGDNRLSVVDGKVQFDANKDEYKEGLKYIKKLYDEKLLYNDTFIIDRNQITALGENETPILGTAAGQWAGMFTINGATSNRICDYVAIPPLKGPSGVASSVKAAEDHSSVKFAVSSSCKYPEVAVKWIDWLFNVENNVEVQATEGFRKAKEGEIGIDGTQALWTQDVTGTGGAAGLGTIQNKGWTNLGIKFRPLESCMRVCYIDEPSRIVAENRLVAYEQNDKVGVDISLKPALMSADDAAYVVDYRTTINNIVDNAFAEFVTGIRSIDKDWDSYVKSLDSAGLKEYISILQKYEDER